MDHIAELITLSCDWSFHMPDSLRHWLKWDVVTRPFFSRRVGSGYKTNGTLSQGPQTLDKKLGGACMRTRLVPHSYQLKICEQSLEVKIKHLYLHTDSRVIVALIAKLLGC